HADENDAVARLRHAQDLAENEEIAGLGHPASGLAHHQWLDAIARPLRATRALQLLENVIEQQFAPNARGKHAAHVLQHECRGAVAGQKPKVMAVEEMPLVMFGNIALVPKVSGAACQ